MPNAVCTIEGRPACATWTTEMFVDGMIDLVERRRHRRSQA
jgi:hypothetical protein